MNIAINTYNGYWLLWFTETLTKKSFSFHDISKQIYFYGFNTFFTKRTVTVGIFSFYARKFEFHKVFMTLAGGNKTNKTKLILYFKPFVINLLYLIVFKSF